MFWPWLFFRLPGWMIRTDHRLVNAVYLWIGAKSYASYERAAGRGGQGAG